jgi:hypothetical protein
LLSRLTQTAKPLFASSLAYPECNHAYAEYEPVRRLSTEQRGWNLVEPDRFPLFIGFPAAAGDFMPYLGFMCSKTSIGPFGEHMPDASSPCISGPQKIVSGSSIWLTTSPSYS